MVGTREPRDPSAGKKDCWSKLAKRPRAVLLLWSTTTNMEFLQIAQVIERLLFAG
jgi:hypothetical protein